MLEENFLPKWMGNDMQCKIYSRYFNIEKNASEDKRKRKALEDFNKISTAHDEFEPTLDLNVINPRKFQEFSKQTVK